jgi:hypothetical protein
MVGNVIATLGGTYTYVGGGLTGAVFMIGQFAAGQNIFVGACLMHG